MKKTKKVPLIAENHPPSFTGYKFITLIQYNEQCLLTIVDNVIDHEIKAYVLDLCGPSGVSEEMIINVAYEWYLTNKDKYPISIELSKRGLIDKASTIYKSINMDFVTRVIGPLFSFPVTKSSKVKRKRKKDIPSGIQINKKVVKIY